MAVVQTPFAAMTLGQQKIYNVIHQQHSPQQHHHHHQIMVTTTGGLTPQTNKSSTTTSVIQTKRPLLAPAPERTTSVLVTTTNNNNNINSNSSSMNPAGDLRCKRKIQFMPYGGPNGAQQQPASVARRNARERNRVKQVNNGFATLRQHIPPSVAAALAPQGPAPTGRGGSKKLSKVETLRLAVEYIRSLKQMIDDHETDLNPANLTGSTMDNVRYYTTSGSPSSTGAGGDQYQSYPILLSTPTCSEASVSPTPSSHSSEGSFSATSGGYTTNLYHHHQENFENYEPKSPEDEELLDAIFSWQQTE